MGVSNYETLRYLYKKVTFACCIIILLIILYGCAGSGASDTANLNTVAFTPSDEPDTRRRARIRLELAANYFEMGQVTVALDEVKQALATDPSYVDAFNLRGLIYMRLGDLQQADDSFRRALVLRANDPDLLHNYGWLLCQQQKSLLADQYFERAIANPLYTSRSKTWMARGLCQLGAGLHGDAENSLLTSYELDASNPVVGFHLAKLFFRRNELMRAQFYIRRLNNSEYSNADSLWLGIKVEHTMGDRVATEQLVNQLRKRFPESKELLAYQRGAFNE